MTDCSAIYVPRFGKSLVEYGMGGARQGDRLEPRKTLSWHHESLDLPERELRDVADDLDLLRAWTKTVVVTHHAPSAKSLTYQQATGRIDSAYASDLESLIPLADLWIHGHTHVPADYRVGVGRVVSNPRGYVGDGAVADFDPGWVVEV